MALQALASFERTQSQEPLDLMVSITGEHLAATFEVSNIINCKIQHVIVKEY